MSIKATSYLLRSVLWIGFLSAISGFVVNSPVSSTHQHLTFSLLASAEDNNESFTVSTVSRRGLGIQAASAILTSTIGLSSQAAFAEEEKEGGKLIEFTVENLNGEPGNTGKFIVKTVPEWAPNGVQRFEKLTEVGFWNDCRAFRVLPNFVVSYP